MARNERFTMIEVTKVARGQVEEMCDDGKRKKWDVASDAIDIAHEKFKATGVTEDGAEPAGNGKDRS